MKEVDIPTQSNRYFSDSVYIWYTVLFQFLVDCFGIFEMILGSKGGAGVRALASHQCGSGSNRRFDTINYVS